MANTKISALTSGNPAQSGDLLPIDRSGSNFSVTAGSIAALAVVSVFGRTGVVTATSGDYSVAQVTGAAPLASPALSGTPTAPTASTGDNSTTIATTAFVKAQSYITGVAWSAIGNAAGALTLANGTNNTTFNQTASTVTWTWANITAATSTVAQGGPSIALTGQYWTGSASAADTWTIQSVLSNGTNGKSNLNFTHTGSTLAQITFPPVNITNGNWTLTGALINGSTGLILEAGASGWGVALSANVGTQPQVITLGSQTSLVGTSGQQTSLYIGGDSANTMKNTFAPTSGTANYVGIFLNPTINQTSTATGNYWGILVNVTQTALLGSATTSKLLDLQVGNTSQFNVDTQGHIVGNGNSRGTASSVSGTTITVSFTNTFATTPLITVTPTTNAGAYFISAASATGFTITYATSGAQTFNWHAIA